MNRNTSMTPTRQSQLQQNIIMLANLRPESHFVVSCYLDISMKSSQLMDFVRGELNRQMARHPKCDLSLLEEEIESGITQLQSKESTRMQGLAFFFSIDSKVKLLSKLPFAAPLRNRLSISAIPDLLPLIQLRELYGRFMFVLARHEGIYVAEVDLGDILVKAWVPSASSSAVSDDNSSADTEKLTSDGKLQNQVNIVGRLLRKGGYCRFFLAGDIDLLSALKQRLPRSSVTRLLGCIPVDAHCTIQKTAALCLRSQLQHRAEQARNTSIRIQHGVRRQKQAVAGVAASLYSVRKGIVDTLVLADDCVLEPGWTCWRCGKHLTHHSAPPQQCPHCDAIGMIERRHELVRLAGQRRIPVEFSDSAALRRLGGVGCLLHHSVSEFVHPRQMTDNTLDLVA